MKKSTHITTMFLCVLSLLFALLSMQASGAGGGTPLKLKGTDLQSMSFMQLTNRGDMPPQSYDTGYNKFSTNIALEGKKVAMSVGSNDDAWDFTLYVNFMEKMYNTGAEPFFKYTTQPTIQEIVKGTESGVLLYWTGDPDGEDPEEQAAAKQQGKKGSLDDIRRISQLSKDEVLPELDNMKAPFPQTSYMADFSITGNGHLGSATQDGYVQSQAGGGTSEHSAPVFAGTLIYNVSLTVDDMGYAKAVIKFIDAQGGSRTWTLEGYMGTAQPQKPPKKPAPPKKPDDDDLKPWEPEPDDGLKPWEPDPDDGLKPWEPEPDDGLAPMPDPDPLAPMPD